MRTFKLLSIIQLLLIFLIPLIPLANEIDSKTARLVAEYKIAQLNKSNSNQIIDEVNVFTNDKGKLLFYIFELTPSGYIVVTADTKLPPVIAYSFLNSYENNNVKGLLINILKADIQNRLKNAHLIPQKVIAERSTLWNSILFEKLNKSNKKLLEQWPPEGTTLTGGWLETNWTQNSPYNNFCPIDPVTLQRSIAGCPAVALAQIINYYQTINGTSFEDSDDYYHAYSGRNYWIDDDFEINDFPSFPTLNQHLDTLTNCYVSQSSLKENEKAALNFACGVAAQQVYTSSISGTFGVNQAYDAYQRFGFSDATLMDDSDTSMYTLLAQNMMEARPVHLAVVDPAGTMGHNLVIDGYNTDDYFHVNFGWGGTYNGWYLLPEEIPYGLTVIEGVIINIAYPPVYTSFIEHQDNSVINDYYIFPNPTSTNLYINFYLGSQTSVEVQILDAQGKLMMHDMKDFLAAGTYKLNYKLIDGNGTKYDSGLYFCKLISNNKSSCCKLIIK